MWFNSIRAAPLFTVFPTKHYPNLSHVVARQARTEGYPLTVRHNASSSSVSLLQLHNLPATSVYIHLPFCRKRCHYCDFPIIALGSSSSKTENDDPRISNYVEMLCREIKATKLDATSITPLKTVFFGGGTPSLVPAGLVSAVLDALSSKFGVSVDAEISMEMDPGTFDVVKMKQLIDLGMNRVSLGVQAFQDELLKVCGRAHGVGEVYEAVEIVKSCEVENWSLDLISSLPHQTPRMWEESLQLTVQAQPTHVSVYDLQVERDTKFGVLYIPGEFPLPSENESAEFYRTASNFLGDAGYEHYEISSYCKSGYRCKHNSTYWKNESYYAFGLGSASYVGGVRFSRPRRLKEYMSYVQNLEDGLSSSTNGGHVDAKDLAMDIVMLSLRTADGLDMIAFREAFGEQLLLSICEVYKPHVEIGRMICVDEQGRNVSADEFTSLLRDKCLGTQKFASLRLSDPDGFLLSNELISLAFGTMTS